jgi:pilus assembly protein CpaB
MSRSRTKNLLLAGVLAALAGLLTIMSVGRAQGGTHEAKATPSLPVLVAARDLPVGLSLDQALARKDVVFQKLIPDLIEPNAVLNPGAVRGKVVLQPIYKGEQITLVRLGTTGQQGLRAQITGTARVMQVSGDAVQLLSGVVHAGDHVDIVASIKVGGEQTALSKVVIRNVLVVTPPAAPSSSTGPDASQQLSATVQLTDTQAQEVFFVEKNADWSFLLRPATRARAGASSPTSASTLLARG